MTSSEIRSASSPGLPDYVLDPNAVLKDDITSWRYSRAPDYSNTRRVYDETKTVHHEAGSISDLVNNLVKNWEIEASFKTDVKDWRTVDHEKYTFAINGGPPQRAEHMLKVGTYNAIIAPNEYYSPETSDFASSHKTFKRMMPTFAWEVLEVYSGPPKVVFKWRHWGTMENDYVGFNDKGENVTAKAHGGTISIQGLTVATVDDTLRVQNLETWFDPLDMFRQIAPNGVATKTTPNIIAGQDLADALDGPADTEATDASDQIDAETSTTLITFSTENLQQAAAPMEPHDGTKESARQCESQAENSQAVMEEGPLVEAGSAMQVDSRDCTEDAVKYLSDSVDNNVMDENKGVHETCSAIDAPLESEETVVSHENMSNVALSRCPFLVNKDEMTGHGVHRPF